MRILRPFYLFLFLLTACNPDTGPATGSSATTVWLDPLSDPDGPFPSDDYTVSDLTMTTGLRLDFTRAKPTSLAMRAIRFFDRADFHMTQESLQTIDGFSTFAPIFIPFSSALDPASVRRENFTVTDLAAGITIPVEAVYFAGNGSWVALYPRRVLYPAHRHVVLIGKGLRDLEGGALAPATRWPIETDDLNRALTLSAARSSDFLGAFRFTAQDSTGELIAIAKDIQSKPPAEPFAMTRSADGSRYEGSITIPDYRNAGVIVPSGPGQVPQPVTYNTVKFFLKLPENFTTLSAPYNVSIWGHGLTGNRYSIPDVDDGAMIGIDAVEHGLRSTVAVNDLVAVKFFDPFHSLQTRENLRQTVIDNVSLAHVLTILDARLQAQFVTGPVIDTGKVGYIGGSLGAIVGGSIAALAPNIDTTLMVVGGAGLSLAFEHGLFKIASPNALLAHTSVERAAFFGMVQIGFDRADPVNYLRHVIHEPLPEHKARNMLFLYVIGDQLVPNPANETYMWAAGLSILGPNIYSNMYGLPELAGPTAGGNVTVDGVRRTAIGYQYNPPLSEAPWQKRHGYLADHAGARTQIERFFLGALDEGYGDVVQGGESGRE